MNFVEALFLKAVVTFSQNVRKMLDYKTSWNSLNYMYINHVSLQRKILGNWKMIDCVFLWSMRIIEIMSINSQATCTSIKINICNTQITLFPSTLTVKFLKFLSTWANKIDLNVQMYLFTVLNKNTLISKYS